MRELTRAQLSLVLRIAAVVFVGLRLLGSKLWLEGFDGADGGDQLNYLMTSLPLTVGLAATLYAVAVLLGRPDPVRTQAGAALDPVGTASVLDLDAPIDHVVFQPATPPKMTDIPIGDPHAAFRPD